MKNNILLLVTGLVCAALAWLFFVYFQDKAITILLFLVLIIVVAKPIKSKFGHRDPPTKD